MKECDHTDDDNIGMCAACIWDRCRDAERRIVILKETNKMLEETSANRIAAWMRKEADRVDREGHPYTKSILCEWADMIDRGAHITVQS